MSNPIEAMQVSGQNLIASLKRTEQLEKGYANIFYEQLVERIKKFDKSIDEDHEVGVKLVSYGNVFQFYLTGLGYQNPYLMIFKGVLDDNSPVELLQHVTQINFTLIKLKKVEPEKPKRKIGFMTE